jgi:hypothetical protein
MAAGRQQGGGWTAATLRLGVGSSEAAGWRQGGVWTAATLRLEADDVTITIHSLGDGYDP